jgi:PhnB protein
MSKDGRVIPYLTVKGGLEAIKYYEDAFDAEVEDIMLTDDGKLVLHAELEINDATLMLADEIGESDGGTRSPLSVGGASVSIFLSLKKPKQVDRMMEQARAAGGEIVAPPEDTFWGARYGKVRDPFGHIWSFNAPLKKKHKRHDDDERENDNRHGISGDNGVANDNGNFGDKD